MIVGYARVSTQDQNAELQVDALEKSGCEQIFQEKITGKLRERPELSQCLRMLRTGDTLIVWKLDRLARSLKDLVEIVQDLNDREIGFKSVTEAIDTTSSGGRLVFHIFGALAEFEHSLIRERTIAGLHAARARGRKGGRKPSMSDSDTRKAAAMLSDPSITKKDVAEHFAISRTTLNASLQRLIESTTQTF
jgi:DNA invertase Pin-like site-specific DNA recombinase